MTTTYDLMRGAARVQLEAAVDRAGALEREAAADMMGGTVACDQRRWLPRMGMLRLGSPARRGGCGGREPEQERRVIHPIRRRSPMR
jgi:hypothetical protein